MQKKKTSIVPLVLASIIFLLLIGVSYQRYKELDQKKTADIINSKYSALTRQIKDLRTSCHKYKWSALSPPCSPQDKSRSVYTVPKLGRFCLEKDSKDFIKWHLQSVKTWESEHLHYFKKYAKKGSTVLDIGAHIGVHTLRLSKAVGDEGQVHSFEPQSKVYQELLANLNLNEIKNWSCLS